MKRPDLKNDPFYSRLVKLSLPIMVQSLMLALVAVADAVMLGRIEQNSMTAVSLATQIQFVQNMFVMSVTGAASILGAQYWGKHDKNALQEIFRIALRITMLICVVFFLLCELAPVFLMKIFTNEEALIPIGANYLKMAGWSYLLVGISQSYLTVMKVSDHTKEVAFVSGGGVVLNILLNAVLIYGLFGLPRMEEVGAALATVIVRVAEIIACIVLSFRKDYIRPGIAQLLKQNAVLFHDFAKCMFPLLGGALAWGIGFTAYSAFMGHLGTDPAAANSVVAVVRDCVCCVCDGAAVGGGILVGNELGAGELERGRTYGNRLVVISFLVGFASTLIMLALTPLIVHLVVLTEQAQKYLYGMMFVMAFYMIGRCVNTITINGTFSAGGDTMFDFYSLMVTMWGIAIPLAALGTFVFHWHPVLVYAFTCLDEVGKIPWVMFHFKKYKWVRDLTKGY